MHDIIITIIWKNRDLSQNRYNSIHCGILLFVQVLDNLTPLIEAHEDLVQDLKNFVEGKPFNLYATEPIINHKWVYIYICG